MKDFNIHEWQAKHLRPSLLTENVQNFESEIYRPVTDWLDDLEGTQAPANVLKAINVAVSILEGRAAVITNRNYSGQASPVRESILDEQLDVADVADSALERIKEAYNLFEQYKEQNQIPSNESEFNEVETLLEDVVERLEVLAGDGFLNETSISEFTEPSQSLVVMVNNYLDSKAISDEEKIEELLELVDYSEQKIEELNPPL